MKKIKVKPFKYPKGYVIGWVYKSYEDYFNDIRSPANETFDYEEKMKKEIIICERLGEKEIRRVNVTGKSNSQIAKIEMGLSINFDFDRYYWYYSWED